MALLHAIEKLDTFNADGLFDTSRLSTIGYMTFAAYWTD